MTKVLINKKYEKLVPPLPDVEYDSLKESIKKNGLWMPIVINEKNEILDGHHRFKICKELGIKKITIQVRKFTTKAEEMIFVGECNLKRRQLTVLQRIDLVRRLEPHYAELAKKRMKSGKKTDPSVLLRKGRVSDELGRKADVSGSQYEKGTKVLEKATKKDIAAINKGDKTITKVYREIKKVENKKKRQKEIKKVQVKLPKTITLHNKAFQKLKIKKGSVSMIITDPPYHDKALPLFEDLAKQASEVLKNGGTLVTYVGQKNIGKIINIMAKYDLEFHWPLTIEHGGASASVFGLKVLVACKIMLWFQKGKYQGDFVRDLIKSKPPNKEDHEWAQSTVESDYYIKHMTIENEIIYDPFLGSGTFGISAKLLKRQFIGCEIDKEHYETARRLISNAK